MKPPYHPLTKDVVIDKWLKQINKRSDELRDELLARYPDYTVQQKQDTILRAILELIFELQ